MAEILLYGIVGDSWDGLDARTLVPLITDGDDELDIRINSPGGYVMEGLAIYNAIAREANKGRTIRTHIDGLAASMASVIAMAGSSIVMADNALMMIHNPWDCACGDAAELRRRADLLDKIRDQLVGIYSNRTGIGADELVDMLAAETWMDAEQALEKGFVTELTDALEAAACNVQPFGFRNVPDHPLITMVAMSRPRAAAAAPNPPKKEKVMPKGTQAANTQTATEANQGATAPQNSASLAETGTTQPAGQATVPASQADTRQVAEEAIATERARAAAIREAVARVHLPAAFADEMVNAGTSIEDARAKILDRLSEAGDSAQIGHNGPARVTQDEREKFVEGATNWILVKAGVARLVEQAASLRGQTIKIDAGEFRGVRNADLAREALVMAGIQANHRDPDLIVRSALTARSAITQTTSDFPVLFETAIHRVLQASYALTPDTWSKFCGIGTVTDFRAHTRYLRGSFGALDPVNEVGEFKNKKIPDLAKETITANTKGNIINLTRQAIVNDDMDVFSGLAVDLGRAAKLTIEIDVYALLAANPTMNDGKALFHEDHGNLAASGAVPSVNAFDSIRVAMASQKDISGNEYLEIRPKIGLFPLGLDGTAKVINGSQYDPDAVNKLQRPNKVAGLFEEIVGTPRLSGTAYYAFADPAFAPAIEVVFLNGVMEPFTDSEEGWRVDGVEWKVRHDYGVGAVNYRSAYKQPGASE